MSDHTRHILKQLCYNTIDLIENYIFFTIILRIINCFVYTRVEIPVTARII